MASRQPFISRVRLVNYKSIAVCDVRLGPLTVLIGPNGGGKSNFLDALAFLARAIETTPNEAIAEHGGLDAILRKVPAPADTFQIEIEAIIPQDSHEGSSERVAYGFEVARSRDTRRPFTIRRESCLLETQDQSLHFEVREGQIVDSPKDLIPRGVRIEPDRLYLQIAGASNSFAELARYLQALHVYNFSNETLRAPGPGTKSLILGNHGERIANVLEAIEDHSPIHKRRLNSYLNAMVPNAVAVDSWESGPYLTLKLRTSAGVDRQYYDFDSLGISDGTIRAIGVLTALFQPAASLGLVRLIGIEEPEVALHPGAAGVLFDALTEASDWVQIVATSQSPDLLDRDDLDLDMVRAVSMEHGLTTIGEIDDASRNIVQDKLYTLGELMRANQITPSIQPGNHSPEPGE